MSSFGLVESVPGTDPEARHVASFDGTGIHYDLYDGPYARTALVVPGFWRDRSHPSMQRLARLLLRHGFRAIVMDVRGHGDSGGTYGFNTDEHHDVAAVVRDVLDSDRTLSSLSLVGLSCGGAIAIAAAARHELPLDSIALISPVADFRMIAPRLNPFTIHRHIALAQALKRPRFSWAHRNPGRLRPLDDVGRVHVPLCLIHVKNDWLINHRHSVALYEAANEPKELHVLEIQGNYHADRIFSVAATAIEPILIDFLSRHARPTE